MDQISDLGQTRSIEEVWVKTEPIDYESSTYFHIKSEDGIEIVQTGPLATTVTSTEAAAKALSVHIKSEITFGDFECTPSSYVPQLTNDEVQETIDTVSVKNIVENSNLDKHQQKHCGKSSSFACDECGKVFYRKDTLRRHKLMHSGVKSFSCDECGLRFAQKCHIKPHKLIHSGEKKISCDICGGKYFRLSHLKQHMRMHTGESNCSVTGEVLVVCGECGKQFKSKNLARHKRIHAGIRPYICDECGAAFKQSAHLKSHKLIHSSESPFQCDECPSKYTSNTALKKHKESHKLGPRIRQRKQARVKRFFCDECGKEFNRKDSLRRHKLMHSGVKSFSCDECGMQFAQKYHIKPHKLTHNRQKISSDKSGTNFPSLSSLQNHKLTQANQPMTQDTNGEINETNVVDQQTTGADQTSGTGDFDAKFSKKSTNT